jgi:hypothetical protein
MINEDIVNKNTPGVKLKGKAVKANRGRPLTPKPVFIETYNFVGVPLYTISYLF